MKKIFFTTIVLLIYTNNVYAENWINNYGFYEHTNEIKAKDLVMNDIKKIYDYENAPNPDGQKIENGRYYVETKYKGGYSGTDADYFYLDELFKTPTYITTQTITEVNNKDVYNKINKNINNINKNSDNIKENTNRISELEETNYIVGGVIRLYDSKKWQVNTFIDYSFNRKNVSSAGIRFTFKLGESYEEKELEKLLKRIKELEGKL